MEFMIAPDRRNTIEGFVAEMEAKLKKNEHKTHWRLMQIEALTRLLEIEVEEFKIARDYMSVGEARKELVDIANFSLILWDRLSTEQQSRPLIYTEPVEEIRMMRIVDDNDTVWWVEGSDEKEAEASFGENIAIRHMVLIEAEPSFRR